MSQRTADELEFRRGIVLGLTLAEVLLLLLFVLILALSWRARQLQDDLVKEGARAAGLSDQVRQLEATLKPLDALLTKLKEKNEGLDTASVDELAIKLAEIDTLEKANTTLKKENFDLKSTLGSVRLIGSDLAKLKALNDAIAAAAKINPQDPPQALIRAMEVLKAVGPDILPGQLSNLRELIRSADHPLEKVIADAAHINPNDPPEALERALAVLEKLGRQTRPDQVMSLDQQNSLAGQLDRTRRERDNLTHNGNGLTYPSCWITAGGQTEYMFDLTIQDDGLIVRDATPGRANDPAMQLVNGVPRNTLIRDLVFTNGTTELFKSSQQQNCRFYSIIRDQTGPMSKQRYKNLRAIVENHFYILLRSDAWAGRPTPVAPGASGIGGPFERVGPR
jgi:hypothetical protein